MEVWPEDKHLYPLKPKSYGNALTITEKKEAICHLRISLISFHIPFWRGYLDQDNRIVKPDGQQAFKLMLLAAIY